MREDFDLTVLLVEHHMGLVMGVASGSTCSTSAARSPRDAEDVQRNPAVIEAYLGADADAA